MSTQGKNKRRQIEVNDVIHNCILSVDSQEEVDFINFCNEACQLSVIQDFEYQPSSFHLFDAVTYETASGKQRTLFREHNYTADFRIIIDPQQNIDFSSEFKLTKNDLSCRAVDVFIDVKGEFAGHDGGRSFSLNQKWVWQIYHKYVYKLIPKKFFAKFGCPKRSFLSEKTKKPRTMFKGFKTISEMLLKKIV